MKLFKKSIIFTFVFIAFAGIVAAKTCNKFSQSDYERALRGDKNLEGVELEGANFKGIDLRGVNFKKADLEKADFRNADLSGASFEKADLEEANLKGAKIDGTIFKEAELEYATWFNGRTCAEDSIGGCW